MKQIWSFLCILKMFCENYFCISLSFLAHMFVCTVDKKFMVWFHRSDGGSVGGRGTAKDQTNKLFFALVLIFLFNISYEFPNKSFITFRERSCFWPQVGHKIFKFKLICLFWYNKRELFKVIYISQIFVSVK